MTVRFLADEDLKAGIIEGLRAREPAVDILDVKAAGLRGTGDSTLLELAAQQNRILITHDRHTMTRHFRERLDAGKPTPGVFILSQQQSARGEPHGGRHSVLSVSLGRNGRAWRSPNERP